MEKTERSERRRWRQMEKLAAPAGLLKEEPAVLLQRLPDASALAGKPSCHLSH